MSITQSRTAWTSTPAVYDILAKDPTRLSRPCVGVSVGTSGTLVYTGRDGVNVITPAHVNDTIPEWPSCVQLIDNSTAQGVMVHWGELEGEGSIDRLRVYNGTWMGKAKGFWRVSDYYTLVTGVSQLNDQSGLGHDVTQGTAANQPAFTLYDSAFNNRSTATFDGVNDSLGVASHADFQVTTNSFLVLCVMQLKTASTKQCVIGKGTNVSNDHFRCMITAANKLQLSRGSDVNSYVASTLADITTTKPLVLGWGVDATSNEVIYVRDTSIERVGIAIAGAGTNALALTIGAEPGGTNPCNMALGEMFFRNMLATTAISNDDIYAYIRAAKARYNI